ncbi:MAG TPA: type II CAAX endopeptidase family protein [Candidatus Polarisedimenticolia bacterium]|jgi:membrane protease YdiL (CAAX protease family)|nr:type II CAAX endopeptidase family protein [Candidatus Polarisedimenticolia bacterium]
MPGEIVHAEPKHPLVASRRHSLVFLAIVAAVIVAGFAAQKRQVAGGGLVESHVHVIPIYVSVTVMNWLLALFVWRGIRARGVSAAALIGGRWGNVRDLLRDLGIAALFWGAFGATAWGIHGLMGEGHEKSVDILLPRTVLEVAVWIATAVSAGFCEEFVFRGYVQRQLLALSQHAGFAIVLQGLVFGAMHAYQGWRAVVTISILGMMFGGLAAWRKTLRIGMVAHGWQDVWSGWLSQVLMGRLG